MWNRYVRITREPAPTCERGAFGRPAACAIERATNNNKKHKWVTKKKRKKKTRPANTRRKERTNLHAQDITSENHIINYWKCEHYQPKRENTFAQRKTRKTEKHEGRKEANKKQERASYTQIGSERTEHERAAKRGVGHIVSVKRNGNDGDNTKPNYKPTTKSDERQKTHAPHSGALWQRQQRQGTTSTMAHDDDENEQKMEKRQCKKKKNRRRFREENETSIRNKEKLNGKAENRMQRMISCWRLNIKLLM